MNAPRPRYCLRLFLLGLLLIVSGAGRLQAGCIDVQVVDAEDSSSIAWATLAFDIDQRHMHADASGRRVICALPGGSLDLRVSHIDYETTEQRVSIGSDRGDTTRLVVFMRATADSGETVNVIAKRHDDHNATAGTHQLLGSELQRNRSGSVASTIAVIPGVRVRSSGPGAEQATVRGVSSDRVVVLEEGRSTGDASTLGADHAISIDAISAERITVLRGPAALLYGASPLGGVIDVGRIRPAEPKVGEANGTIGLSATSNATGLALGGGIAYRASNELIGTASVSGRLATSPSTPLAEIEGTDRKSWASRIGLDYRNERFSFGLDGSLYRNRYGVPSTAESTHPDVEIIMQREDLEADLQWQPSTPSITQVIAEIDRTMYEHEEIEPNGSIGTRYTVTTNRLHLQADHQSIDPDDIGGSIAVGYELENFDALGLRIDPTTSHHLHGVVHEHTTLGRAALSAGLRLDYLHRSSGDPGEQPIARDFLGLSGAVGAHYTMFDGVDVALNLLRTFRPPGVVELFGRGPHAASFTYEVGNVDLQAERATAIELSTTLRSERIGIDLQGYLYSFDRYLIATATGDTNRATFLPIHQFDDEAARLIGFDAALTIGLLDDLRLDVDLSYVTGDRTTIDEPLPEIPPLLLRPRLAWSPGRWHIAADVEIRDAQDRVAPFESGTSGSVVVGGTIQHRLGLGRTIHLITLGVENLFDATWYDHLSRLRSRYPAVGRNLMLNYRVSF